MSHKLPILLAGGIAIAWALSANPVAGFAELPLSAYTELAQRQLKSEVLPRLFYSGTGEAKSACIEIVESGKFLAVARELNTTRGDFQINSVSIAVMDRVAEADYAASSIGDYRSLDDYVRAAASTIVKFAASGRDWRLMLEQVPTFAKFYSKSDPAEHVDASGYLVFRNITLTNMIGSVVVRELTEIDMAHRDPSVSAPDAGELNKRAAEAVSRAKFAAAPASALAVYSLLKNVGRSKLTSVEPDADKQLEKSLCNEANFQSYLINTSDQSQNSRSSFGAGRKLIMASVCP
jgi:hypothetical protein